MENDWSSIKCTEIDRDTDTWTSSPASSPLLPKVFKLGIIAFLSQLPQISFIPYKNLETERGEGGFACRMLQPGVCMCSDLGNTSPGLFGINVTPKDGSQAGGQNAVTITLVSGPGGAVAASG